ncbi:MAG TPA: hypothetical protein VFJ58_14420 [Armatimonadota bacterium]|nr:hypothetical protein [Armatimonadota bacterium]
MVLDEKFAALVIAQIDELRQHLRKMEDPAALAEMRPMKSDIGFRR